MTNANPPSVLICAVNWNGRRDTLECLDSLYKLTYPKDRYSVMAIDNASNDGSCAQIKEEFPECLVLKNSSNLGYVRAVNQGVEYGLRQRFDYIWILNNDVIVDKDSLGRLIDAGEDDAGIGVLSPVIYDYSRTERISNCGYRINFFTGWMKKLKAGKDVFENPKQNIASVDSVLGCALLVKTPTFRKIGRYRSVYWSYFEETDFNTRTKRAGLKVVLVKDSRAWHKEASTMNRMILRRAYLLLRNLFIFELLNARLLHILVFIPYYFGVHIPYFIIRGSIYGIKTKLNTAKPYVDTTGNRKKIPRSIFKKIVKAFKALITGHLTIECDRVLYEFDKVPLKKIINWILVELSIIIRKPSKPWGYPTFLQVEPSNNCNLCCALCPVTEGMQRPSGTMEFATFKKLIDEIGEYIFIILLWDWGEPFLNTHIYEMIAYARSKGIKIVSSTNAHLFADRQEADKLVRCGPDVLIVAVDGISQETYSKYRNQGNLQVALTGIRNIIERKDALRVKTPLLNFRFMVMRHNEHEVPQLESFAGNLGVDLLTLKTLNPYSNDSYRRHEAVLDTAAEGFIPENPRYRRFSYSADGKSRIRLAENPCRNLWNNSTVHCNGAICSCTYDYDERFIFGNIEARHFKDIWISQAYRRMREEFRANWEKIPICGDCSYAYKGGSCIDETVFESISFNK